MFFAGTIVSRASMSSHTDGPSGPGHGYQAVVSPTISKERIKTDQKWGMPDPWFLSPNQSMTFKEEPFEGEALTVLGMSKMFSQSLEKSPEFLYISNKTLKVI